ncbi:MULTISPECIES: DUF4188 domain-containing protein [Streptomyces]|uniref:DUF4188 domain-containing protein n=1 Tax=Streptomyces TaxID=1883 RepID=UPI00163BC316|nr:MULTISPECIES: DUF4188 domain-containing protein [Streptomyces]MBC2874640.1 DUF4188 domain-containing protein [Streptomyces sp. TYQ1024]UBI36594.1 DUF4188 domain-containing protein [Streptomyces mobaraensis]UKW29186.1 DUF4188 domain-containing protein [Streptomyces sp. TYQ1024]
MGKSPIEGRVTAAAEGDVVVFLIGMRINRWRSARHWIPVFDAMRRMLGELGRDPDAGLLGYRLLTAGPREYTVLQYWESREKLLAYAADRDRLHRPAWAAFNRRARDAAGRVGIWHETYVVPAGSYETIYSGMPAHGLGAAYGVEAVARRGERAAERLGAPAGG